VRECGSASWGGRSSRRARTLDALAERAYDPAPDRPEQLSRSPLHSLDSITDYKLIRSDLSAAAGYPAPQIGGLDTTMLSAAQREEMRQGNDAQLKAMEGRVPSPLVEALRPRAAELRKQPRRAG